MKRCFLLCFTLCWFSTCVLSQTVETADEINIRSKEFLIARDMKKAVPLFRQAAEMGQPEAQYNYGVCFQQGIEVPKNDTLAHLWFLRSARGGYKDAQYQLAVDYATGTVVSRDDVKAFTWWHACAMQTDPECMFRLIGCYLEGRGTQVNSDSVLYWGRRLASLDPPANLQSIVMQVGITRLNLARMYYAGTHIPRNLEAAYTWLLLFNENKKVFNEGLQHNSIDLVKEIEKQLNAEQLNKAKTSALKILRHDLRNYANRLITEQS